MRQTRPFKAAREVGARAEVTRRRCSGELLEITNEVGLIDETVPGSESRPVRSLRARIEIREHRLQPVNPDQLLGSEADLFAKRAFQRSPVNSDRARESIRRPQASLDIRHGTCDESWSRVACAHLSRENLLDGPRAVSFFGKFTSLRDSLAEILAQLTNAKVLPGNLVHRHARQRVQTAWLKANTEQVDPSGGQNPNRRAQLPDQEDLCLSV